MTTGTVMIFVSPDGRVIAQTADFGRGGPAGFTQAEAQKRRCDRQLDALVFDAFASSVLTEATDEHERARVVRRLEDKGYHRHTIAVEVPA